ncbi:Multi antimicrobial extrusion protein [Syntrophomonas zehnderi OL-4]|uniref:Probable multidrug resistance protein NorM n=1 Tax=Syntrophomonas zehnderi OL-4 TaxID=690567 RepID=A0A0E4GC32_9FIRM|nr:MATE family efflux transporter [Syntrophomonas zehnderi]CFY02132.1 Multi antimicrobial extrusion protein [Syntrophomonas zehnderi OL-4]
MVIKKYALGEERVGRLIVRLSFPAMAGMLLSALLGLIDTFFVSRLGSAALAALTICIPIEILLVSMGSATGVGITSLLSRTLGKNELAMADNIAWHGIAIGVFYGIFFSWLGVTNLDMLLILFGCTPEIFSLCRDYLYIVLMGSVFTFIPLIAGHILQGEGNTYLPMLTSIIAISLNVMLDPLFIFGLGPLPAMNLTGAAVAMVLAQIITTLFILFKMYHSRVMLTWSIRHFHPSPTVIAKIYQVGLPTLVMELLTVIIMTSLNKILAGFGYTAVAALGVFFRIRSLFFMPIYGLAQGAMPIAGFAYGARQNDRVKETIIKASMIAAGILLVAWLVMHNYALEIIQLFSQDPKMTVLGVNCLKLATFFLPIMGPIIILNTVLQGIGKGTSAMWLSLIRQIGFFWPALVLLPRFFGLNGVWLAFSISELLSGFLAVFFFIRLWIQLQEYKHYTIMFLFKKGYILNRFFAWLKW